MLLLFSILILGSLALSDIHAGHVLPATLENWPALQKLGNFTHDIDHFVQIDERIYMITKDDHVYVVGRDRPDSKDGFLTHLGLGANKHYVGKPTEVVELSGKKIVKICQGHEHMLALDGDGYVYAWGWNDYGQLGLGNNVSHFRPIQVEHVHMVEDIACGYASSYAIDGLGRLYSWGSNVYGQLGFETQDQQLHTPVRVPLTQIVQVEAYGEVDYVLAVTSSGQVYGWGEKSGDQPSKPVEIRSKQTLIAHSLTTTRYHGFILDHDGRIHVKQLGEEHARLFWDGEARLKWMYGHKGVNETLVAETLDGQIYAWWNVSLGGQHYETLAELKFVADSFAMTVLPQFAPMVSLAPNLHNPECESAKIIAKLYDNRDISDFRFTFGNKTIHVHRVILALASQHMKRQFETIWSNVTQVEMVDYDFDVFSQYVRFLYADQLDGVRGEKAVSLLSLANKLGETRLKQKIHLMTLSH